MKAIETRYNGYSFRSRLEARWAVFFDAARIQYRYEHEGFDIDGEPYLPDFWLPEMNLWAEVKPTTFTQQERHLCERLAELTHRDCILLEDIPDVREYEVVGTRRTYTLQIARGVKGENAIEKSRQARFEYGESGMRKFTPRKIRRNPASPLDEQMQTIHSREGWIRKDPRQGLFNAAGEIGTNVALGFVDYEFALSELLKVCDSVGMRREESESIINEQFQWAEDNMPY